MDENPPGLPFDRYRPFSSSVVERYHPLVKDTYSHNLMVANA